MPLREELEQQGSRCFKGRNYWPLLMIIFFVLALRDFGTSSGSHHWARMWEWLCFSVSLFGLCVRAYTSSCVPRGTSARSTKELAAKALNTKGMYSIVRNPLYLGNFFIWCGVVAMVQSFWLFVVMILIFWMYYERIIFAEEEFLRKEFGSAFVEWAARTPIFFPRFTGWKRSPLPFSWRNALRKEYSGFFAIIVAFTVLDLVQESVVAGRVMLDWLWAALFVFGAIVYLLLLILKKKTHVLDLEGR